MIFEEVIGHEEPRRALARLLASGKIPHALLFHGPEGVGKRLVADLFAASLLCEAPRRPSGEACGQCLSCRKVAHGNHPDLLVVTRLPKKEKAADADGGDAEDDDAGEGGASDLRAFLVVGQIRELTRHASFAPREGARRVILIDPADRMNAEAQNALLKTLEEPPGAAVIVLVASRPHALLPTVRSRCFALGFGSLAPDRLADALRSRGMEAAEARRRASLAEGRPGRAIGLDLEASARRRDDLLDALLALADSRRGVAELSGCAEALVGEDEATLLEGLALVAALSRDAARAASGAAELLHADAADRLARLGSALGAARAADIVALADRLRGDLRSNVNKTLVAETLLAAFAGRHPLA